MVFCLMWVSVPAQSPEQRRRHFNLEQGVALQGYDPVSYFSGKPVEGSKNYKAEYQGVTYYFADAVHLEQFRKLPAKYEPRYGGWCAYSMGNSGEKVPVDPKTFKIIEGKLYLFYNRYFNNTLKSWNKDEVNLKNKADANWQKYR